MTDAATTTAPIAVVTTTVSDETIARSLAHSVLQHRLAACVQVEPITAYFHWEGACQEEREQRLVFKTLDAAVPALLELLQDRHPYALPQLVAQGAQASAPYAEWVAAQINPPADPAA